MCSALEPGDYLAGTYRGHGHALAKGTDPDALLAEMLGRTTGVCGGRAGSMNVIDVEHGLVGCFGIVGGSIAAATGAALAAKRQGRVAVAMFGDGATNQGYFHECLNFAQVFSLPAVFVCENNFYGEFTPMTAVTAGQDIAARAGAFGIPVEGGRRQRRVGGPRGRARGRCSAPARGRGRRCSSARPTATTATPRPTRPATGRRTRSSAGSRATRSRSRAAVCLSSGWPSRTIAEVEDATRARMDRAVERGAGGTVSRTRQAETRTEFAP